MNFKLLLISCKFISDIITIKYLLKTYGYIISTKFIYNTLQCGKQCGLPTFKFTNTNTHTLVWHIGKKISNPNGPARIQIIKNKLKVEWILNNLYHRDNDLPARIIYDKNSKIISQEWWKNGIRHRDNNTPAIIRSQIKYEAYWVDGELHRFTGPAISFGNHYKEWYVHNERHCITGPAVIYANGTQKWYQNNMLHRSDGPAVIYGRSDKYSNANSNGAQEWWVRGKLHRENAPAITIPNIGEFWYIYGKLHRIDGPAIHIYQKYEYWYDYGLCHRDSNLPSIIHYDENGEIKIKKYCEYGQIIRNNPAKWKMENRYKSFRNFLSNFI